MKIFSTPEVAKLVGVHTITIERWLTSKKIAAPKSLRVGNRISRHWTEQDIERVKRYKAEHYWEGRGPRSKKGK